MTDFTCVFGPRAEGVVEAEKAARVSDRYFVHGAGQLAPYKSDRRPTGHILTAWEALDAFGIDVLEEATEYGAAVLKRSGRSVGQVLKRRRESLSLSCASVARAAAVSELDAEAAESSTSGATMGVLNRLALVLGMDERRLVRSPHTHDMDDGLAIRLRTLQSEGRGRVKRVSSGTALLLAEAASIIRIQHRLRDWLGISGDAGKFEPNGLYESWGRPAWKAGYGLAEEARKVLRLGRRPILSMLDLVEERLGIPVIQAPLRGNPEIAGATVATTDGVGHQVRGIVLNIVGANENVWVRRATLAHELGHLLYDPDERIENLRIDSYAEGETDPEGRSDGDPVEQRANAFAVAFLAPNEAVREIAPFPFSADAIARTMREFGIGRVAAQYHIYNCHYRTHEVSGAEAVAATPSDEQEARENSTIYYFPLHDTPDQRRGRFAHLVAKCHEKGLLSKHTAALYLRCEIQDLDAKKLETLTELYE